MLRSFLFAVAFYLTTALYLLFGSWLLIAPRSWAMAGLKSHARACLWLLRWIVGTEIEVRGKDKLPDGSVLVVSKHQSAWDTFALVPLFRDPAIVLKDELKWIPFYGWFCVKFGHILVRRDKGAAALKNMLAQAREKVAAKREILIFPEGTRQAPGAPPAYKPGYVALYEGLDVPCVPLALNSGLYWPRRQFMRYPGKIIVEFLDPVAPGLNRKDFKLRVETALEEASHRLLAEAATSPDAPADVSLTLKKNKN